MKKAFLILFTLIFVSGAVSVLLSSGPSLALNAPGSEARNSTMKSLGLKCNVGPEVLMSRVGFVWANGGTGNYEWRVNSAAYSKGDLIDLSDYREDIKSLSVSDGSTSVNCAKNISDIGNFSTANFGADTDISNCQIVSVADKYSDTRTLCDISCQ